MKEEREDSRKNVILLTIIAIATMIVVLVGATFAYLASQVYSEGQANIEAATNAGNDVFLINAGSRMEIYADTDNFKLDYGNQVANTDGTVTLQTTSTDAVSYAYDVYVSVFDNNFEYTSGACYRKTTEVVGTPETQCTNGGNVWVRTKEGYACYQPSTDARLADDFNNNSLGCLADVRNMWLEEDAAELVIDLYKVDPTITTENACISTGLCVNKLHSVVSGITTQASCTGSNVWIPSKYLDGMCYKTTAAADLTTVTSGNVSLLDNVQISATNESVTDYYFTEITLINYDHNQIVNGNKNFSAALTFKRITS